MTTPDTPIGMVPVAEFAVASDALADLSLLQNNGVAAFLLPDITTTQGTSPPFHLLVPESASLAALQLLARESSARDPRGDECPQCGFAGLRISPARRLLGLAELLLANQLASVISSCPHCGWSPSHGDPSPRNA